MLEPNTKVQVTSDDPNGQIRKLLVNSVHTNWIFNAPTGDCQSYSISNVADIIARHPKDWVDVLVEIQHVVGKNCLLINVRRDSGGYDQPYEFLWN